MRQLATIDVKGTAHEMGAAIGRHASDAIHREVRPLSRFQRLLAAADPQQLAALEAAARQHFPRYLAEIEGLAEGADWPFREALVWNFEGDLEARAEPPAHGCTTVFERTDAGLRIGHNEDGAQAHATSGFLVKCRPAVGLGFTSFCYPGRICGNSFAVNVRGLVQTINNLRVHGDGLGVPRQVVARALLDASDLDGAAAILADVPRASGYHHGLGQAGDPRLLAIEAPAAGVAIRNVAARHVHANHLVEPDFADVAQEVTPSSRGRQARAEALFLQDGRPALDVLLDRDGPLPIHVHGRSDDDSMTLATALFEVDAERARLTVHLGDRRPANVVEVHG